MSNLRLIDETKITSSVSSINIEDVFSSDFDIYRITCTDLTLTGTTYVEVGMRLIDSTGAVLSGTDYGHGARQMMSWLSYVDAYDNNNTQFRRAFTETTDQAPEVAGSSFWIFNPYSSSHHTYMLHQNTQAYGGSYHSSMHGFGIYKVNKSITGFQAIESDGSRPMAAGSFRTYGLRRDT
tara:strand:- start:732 stop:1271 length:540 start_codon:yes stop_codon:yes gene_type:complete